MNSDLTEYLRTKQELVNRWLDRLTPLETTPPGELHRAMRYSLFSGGKRLRPILTIATAEMFQASEERVLSAACALEMIHTYSLIHDDLPALDNDDLRRGRPTCHKVFGDAIAILAGDALLTLAFKTLAEAPIPPEHLNRKLRVISEIATAAGTVEGMIGGQVVDLLSEGESVDPETLAYIHRSKTGALMTVSVRVGAILGGATEDELLKLTQYGERIGLAFQIADDLLDVTGTAEEVGKAVGKDAQAKKATYPQLYGVEASRRKAEQLVEDAIAIISSLSSSEPLFAIARLIIERRY